MPKKFLAVCLNPVIQKTLVFDSLAIDHVNRARIARTDASGKGINVARVLSQRGAEVAHLTHAGGANREWFLSLCAADGLDVRWVDSGSEARICTTVIDETAHTATELVEEASPIGPGTEERLLELFDATIPEFDVLVVSGTKATGYSDKAIPAMVQKAAARGALIVLDIKGKDLLACLPFRPTVVKPNLSEFLGTFPAPAGSGEGDALREHVRATAAALKARFGTELVITRGSKPIWFNEGGLAAAEPIVPAKAINPTGSGDSFTAGLAFALANGAALREAIADGARMGALNAENLKPGSIR